MHLNALGNHRICVGIPYNSLFCLLGTRPGIPRGLSIRRVDLCKKGKEIEFQTCREEMRFPPRFFNVFWKAESGGIYP